jgi:hypothetical protein
MSEYHENGKLVLVSQLPIILIIYISLSYLQR